MARRLLPRSLGELSVIDLVVAVALFILAVGGLLTGQVQEKPLSVTIPIAAVSTLVIVFRTRYPIAVTAVVSVLAVAQAVFAGSSSNTLWALVVFLLSAYTVAAECAEGWALIGLVLVLGSQFVCEWLNHGSDYAFDALVFGGVWMFGRGTRSWRNRATHAEQHRHDLARIAVADERARIARELHDVVAHSLSVIAVQADAAEAALGKDPSRAGAPMRAIRDSARQALVDMRQLLHVLRAEDDRDQPSDLTPARGIGDLPHLLTGMREAGLPIEADIRIGGGLSAGMELTVFRIVQEGLTNVRKHAGTVPTSLTVVAEASWLRIEIVNAPPDRGAATSDGTSVSSSLSTGHGLVGLGERVHAAGGSVQAAPTPAGGFELVVLLPIDSGYRS